MRNVQVDPDEAVVVRRVLDGDVNAFAILMDRHREHVANIVAAHVPRDRVAEVAHDTFIRAWKSLQGWRKEKPFQHWLASIAIRTCYDFWRERYRNKEDDESSLSEDTRGWLETVASSSAEAPEEEAAGREAHELLRWALNSLSPEDRMVLTLVHLEEKSVAEAAELLGWSSANVKIRAFRARGKLRKLLAKHLPEELAE